MTEAPLVLLTRPIEESLLMANILQEEGYKTLIEPMLKLKRINHPRPDWKNYQGLIITSIHALHGIEGDPKIPVFLIGQRTAAAARAKGFAIIKAVAPTIHDLLQVLARQKADKPFLYLRGENITASIPALLPGLQIEERIAYGMEAATGFSPSTLSALQANQVDIILFFSVRSAQNFMTLASKAQLFPAFARIKALCLGKGMVECLKAADWAGIHVSDTPDREGILKKLYTLKGA